jgi:hypothetical protein
MGAEAVGKRTAFPSLTLASRRLLFYWQHLAPNPLFYSIKMCIYSYQIENQSHKLEYHY